MKNIIVPIDFSENSLNGLELAIVIGNKAGGNIQMVYVQKNSNDYSVGTVESEYNWARRKFDEIVKEYKRRLYSSIKLTYIIKLGKIFHEIVNQAHAFNDSFIVCSTHGASGFEEHLIGSNAFKIISYSHKPVFAIRGNNIPLNFNKIVIPVDLSPDTRQKVPYTIEFANLFDSEVHIVTVTTTNSEEVMQKLRAFQKQVVDYVKEKGLKYITDEVHGNSISSTVIDYAKHVQAKLISIMTEQNSLVSNFAIGSHTQQMLNKSPIPLLCTSPKELHINSGFHTQG